MHLNCLHLIFSTKRRILDIGSQSVKKRICISLRVTFSNSIIFTVINEYGQDGRFEIKSVFLGNTDSMSATAPLPY